MSLNLLTPEGRIVGGHPMARKALVNEKTKQPILDSTGAQAYETYIGLAIPKNGATDFKQPHGANRSLRLR